MAETDLNPERQVPKAAHLTAMPQQEARDRALHILHSQRRACILVSAQGIFTNEGSDESMLVDPLEALFGEIIKGYA